jgi:elongation factor G
VLPACETIAVVVDALKSIDSVTRRTLMAVAAERKIPRMIVINKIDEHNLDLPGLVASIRETFGASACRSTCRRGTVEGHQRL